MYNLYDLVLRYSPWTSILFQLFMIRTFPDGISTLDLLETGIRHRNFAVNSRRCSISFFFIKYLQSKTMARRCFNRLEYVPDPHEHTISRCAPKRHDA